jgi:hypothetical protein
MGRYLGRFDVSKSEPVFRQTDSVETSQSLGAAPNSPDGAEVDLLLPKSWNEPLWKRLLGELRDRVSPEKLPPLQLTSRPSNVGMLIGDRVSLPWYRTVFTNLGDVISPETLPPLELESTPIDVGELIADQMSRPWWASLLRNLADQVAPEKMPPLELTSKPMEAGFASGSMLLFPWSSVITTPKVFLPDKPKPKPEYELALPKPDPLKAKRESRDIEVIRVVETDLKRDLHWSVLRQRVWIGLVALEILVLAGSLFWWS